MTPTQLREAIEQLEREGWKVVPKEPNAGMLDAALRANMQHLIDCIKDPSKSAELGSEEMCRETYRQRYASMLSAAPSYSGGE